jgi:hypothetical protein
VRTALRFAEAAEVIATEGGFHEVTARVWRVRTDLVLAASSPAAPVTHGGRWSARTRAVVRSLELMPALARSASVSGVDAR